jgi:arsenate reductase
MIKLNQEETMSDTIKIYQKPTCSKCRETLGILRECGVEFESINYYETPLNVEELRGLINKLGISPRDLLRKGEQAYRDLGLGQREVSDDELIKLMVENPDLMQRPIVVRGDKAVLARPPENVEELL